MRKKKHVSETDMHSKKHLSRPKGKHMKKHKHKKDRAHYFTSAVKHKKSRKKRFESALSRWRGGGKSPGHFDAFHGVDEFGNLGKDVYYELPKYVPNISVPRKKVAAYLKAKHLQKMGSSDVRKAFMKKFQLGDLNSMKHRLSDISELGALNEPLGFRETFKEAFSKDSLINAGFVTAGLIGPELIRRQVVARVYPKINELAVGQAGNLVDLAIGVGAALALERFGMIKTEQALAIMTGTIAGTAAKAVKMTGWIGDANISDAVSDVLASLPSGYSGEVDENVGILTEGQAPRRSYETEEPSNFADNMSPMDAVDDIEGF